MSMKPSAVNPGVLLPPDDRAPNPDDVDCERCGCRTTKARVEPEIVYLAVSAAVRIAVVIHSTFVAFALKELLVLTQSGCPEPRW